VKILRNTDEWIGLLVVACVVLFVAAALQAGLLSDWFRPVASLRILLPETGSGGLSTGADIQVLGTHVGNVRRIVVDPSQRMYAEAELEEPATGFIRRDSVGVIKKSFGVAGAALLDVSRGTGAPLDWHFAVIEATTERAPTESIGALIDEVKLKIYPVLDDAGRAMKALADTVVGISNGQGNIGRVVKGEELIDQVTPMLANLKAATELIDAELADVRGLTATMTRPDGVPALLKRVEASLASVQATTHDLAGATPQLPAITRNAAASTADLPALLTQTQQTVAELERLSKQLRNTWPLSGSAVPEQRRLPAAEVRP
jgi:phospholipid/cholesterol/gamma-HCH transport system substrate-binding protein